jgi:hypothetical protein
MKVGIIFECGRDGADVQVCRHLVEKLRPDTKIDAQFMDEKKSLIENCGLVASILVESCDRVVILWDLFPAWREKHIKPCRREDRANIFSSLQASNVPMDKVALVCIEEELEAWLLADKRALKSMIAVCKHPHAVGNLTTFNNPERIDKPKTRLTKIFNKELGPNRRYIDYQDAIKIARAIPDFNKIKRSATFRCFAEKSVGVVL